MVRLKAFRRGLNSKNIMLFQFQYGAIEGQKEVEDKKKYLYFNSSMVRLKDLIWNFCYLASSNFNSSMVRLKDLVGRVRSMRHTSISIPVWCD